MNVTGELGGISDVRPVCVACAVYVPSVRSLAGPNVHAPPGESTSVLIVRMTMPSAVVAASPSRGSCAVNGIAQAATVLNGSEPTRFGKSAMIEARIEMSAGASDSVDNALKQLSFGFV